MQVKTPKVSVCVVTYNQENYIRQCLQSIVDQETDFDFEVIVGDDCSTDGTRAIIKEFSDKYPNIVKPIIQPKNIGPYKNFIFVHQTAKGQYIAHIDGDDYALPGKLQAQVKILDKNSNCNAVWHRVDFINDKEKFSSGDSADLSIFHNSNVSFDQSIYLGYISVHSSLMYRKTASADMPNNTEILDIFRTWWLLSTGDGYILDKTYGVYRVGSTGSISKNSKEKIVRLAINHAKYFLEKFPDKRPQFFIYTILNFIIEAKNLRSTAIDYLFFSYQCWHLTSPFKIIYYLNQKRKIQVKW